MHYGFAHRRSQSMPITEVITAELILLGPALMLAAAFAAAEIRRLVGSAR